jgi:ectoine hydroxylase-related dioxygenase (phytanoyl-CoA dioxygenase family)
VINGSEIVRNFDSTDYRSLSLGEQIRRIEVEGYVVLPDLLSPQQVAELKAETAQLPTKGVDYSERQRGCSSIQFRGGAITRLIAHPPTIAFLQEVFGGDVVMMTYAYARSEPGHPGISLHADGQPYGSRIFGYEGSCPWLIRVLYYLDDLTGEVSPFRVVPRSHLCMHADANPYRRYEEHPEELAVTATAGSAVLINHRVFHGNYPNVGDRPRELLAIAYRPAWAGPIEHVDDWDAAELERVPADVRTLLTSRNQRVWEFEGGNKPANMAREAPGMNPSRWDR